MSISMFIWNLRLLNILFQYSLHLYHKCYLYVTSLKNENFKTVCIFQHMDHLFYDFKIFMCRMLVIFSIIMILWLASSQEKKRGFHWKYYEIRREKRNTLQKRNFSLDIHQEAQGIFISGFRCAYKISVNSHLIV